MREVSARYKPGHISPFSGGCSYLHDARRDAHRLLILLRRGSTRTLVASENMTTGSPHQDAYPWGVPARYEQKEYVRLRAISCDLSGVNRKKCASRRVYAAPGVVVAHESILHRPPPVPRPYARPGLRESGWGGWGTLCAEAVPAQNPAPRM
ncbi:hypothetical protein VTO73DRAFT_9567 [Trametes versicolor]